MRHRAKVTTVRLQ